jgi:hypothetical protein
MIVLAPPEVNDPDLGPVALATVWPDHPAELLVTCWHPEDGETSLDAIAGPVGSIDYNILDLPETFVVRVSSIPRYSVLSPRGVCSRRSSLVEPEDAEVDAVADRRYCHACGVMIELRGELARGLCCECSGDDPICVDWRLLIVDEDRQITWTSGWDFLSENPDHRADLLALHVGMSFEGGGGAQPWYAVVRLPNVE